MAHLRRLERRHWMLLCLLGGASFFQGYDLNLVSVALKQIRQSFGLSQSGASLWLGVLYLGALPAVLLTRQADRRGRRIVLLVSVLGYSVTTGLTALAPSIAVFAACQFLARGFLGTEQAVAWVMVAEELPAESRGLGFGWLATSAALGVGTSSVLFGPVGIPWRWMYAIAAPPLLALAVLRRRLPESQRFASAQRRGLLSERWREILQPPNRRWLWLLSLTAVLGAMTTHTVALAPDFLQTQRHLSTATVGWLVTVGGTPAILVQLAAGPMSDRFGRKVVGCSFAALAVCGALLFFFVARSPLAFGFAIALTLSGTLGARPALGAFTSELFTTPQRAFGGAAVSVALVLGEVLSLTLGGLLLHLFGNLPDVAAVLILGPIALIVVVAVWFPETKGQELEAIVAPESVTGPELAGKLSGV
ncbi:MAG TPA: MFS transporter [Acidimicrobiales bacterium]|nr:MFS transporter [Acidimicrobiales bacterium]